MAGITDSLGPASAIGEGIIGGVQMFTALAKEKKDKAALAALHDPFYAIQNEYLQNRNIASEQSGGGLPDATKDYVTSEMQRGLGAGISGTLQSGGGPNDINKLFQTYSNSIDKTAASDAEQHVKNIQYFREVNKDLAGQKTTQWAINQYQPIQEKKKQLSQNILADQQNASGGANTAIGSLSALGTSLQNNDLLSKLFGTDDTGGLNPFTKLITTKVA